MEEDDELKDLDNEDAEVKSTRTNLTSLPLIKQFKVDSLDPNNKQKKVTMKVKGLGIPSLKRTPTGLPSVDVEALKTLVGNPKSGNYGTAY